MKTPRSFTRNRLISHLRIPAAITLIAAGVVTALAAVGGIRVSVGNPGSPFSQNKQNEPAIAVDAHHNNIMVAGSNDEIDEQACSSQFPSNPCPFTPGVGVSGVYFSFDSGKSWAQPTYTGYTARGKPLPGQIPLTARQLAPEDAGATRVNLRPFLRDLRLVRWEGEDQQTASEALEIDLWLTPSGTARPVEVLGLLGLTDLFEAGTVLERSRLELHDESCPGGKDEG